MMEQQGSAVALTPADQPVISDPRLRHAFDLGPQGFEARRQPISESIDGRLVRGRGFHLDHLAQQPEDLILTVAEGFQRKKHAQFSFDAVAAQS
jgi:hypothetical protein